jgi:hypothetical protein
MPMTVTHVCFFAKTLAACELVGIAFTRTVALIPRKIFGYIFSVGRVQAPSNFSNVSSPTLKKIAACFIQSYLH